MILSSALAVSLASTSYQIPVVEWIDDTVDYVVVEALIMRPEAMPKADLAAWHVLGEVLKDGSSSFPRSNMALYGSQAGIPPKIVVWDDFIRIQIAAPKAAANVAWEIVDSLLRRPALRDEEIDRVRERLMTARIDPWSAALFPYGYEWDLATNTRVRILQQRAFRPENIVMGYGGGIEFGSGPAQVESRFRNWNPPVPPNIARYEDPIEPRRYLAQGIAAYELYRELPPTANRSLQILLATALSSGKASSIFRAWRDDHALAYRLAGVLWPKKDSLEFRLLLLRADGDEEDAELLTLMRESLLDDIDTWNEQTLERAIVMARSSVNGRNPISPMWIDPTGPMSDTVSDKLGWFVLDYAIHGPGAQRIDPEAFVDLDIEDFKSAARDLVEQMNGRIVPADL